MSREIQILWVGRRERDGWQGLCDRYQERIERIVPIRERIVRVPTVKEPKARQQLEREALEAAMPEPSWVIALDRRGQELSSVGFARRLEALREDWPHPLVFLLGSDLGLEKGLLEAARERISLGKMTLPHHLARLILLEQIYRALSIGVGIKYHREPL